MTGFFVRLPEMRPMSWFLGTQIVASVKAKNRCLCIDRSDMTMRGDRWLYHREEICLIGKWIGGLADECERLQWDLVLVNRVVWADPPFDDSKSSIEAKLAWTMKTVEKGMWFLDDLEPHLITNRNLDDGPDRIRRLLVEFYMDLEGRRELIRFRGDREPDPFGISRLLAEDIH